MFDAGYELADQLVSIDLSEYNPCVEDWRTGRLSITLFYYFALGLAKAIAQKKIWRLFQQIYKVIKFIIWSVVSKQFFTQYFAKTDLHEAAIAYEIEHFLLFHLKTSLFDMS